MPPIAPILPRLLFVYLKRIGLIVKDRSPLEGHFITDRWQRWGKATSGDSALTLGLPRARLSIEVSTMGSNH